MISGAMYSGVPHNVYVRPFTFLAKPKSVICPAPQNINVSSTYIYSNRTVTVTYTVLTYAADQKHFRKSCQILNSTITNIIWRRCAVSVILTPLYYQHSYLLT